MFISRFHANSFALEPSGISPENEVMVLQNLHANPMPTILLLLFGGVVSVYSAMNPASIGSMDYDIWFTCFETRDHFWMDVDNISS